MSKTFRNLLAFPIFWLTLVIPCNTGRVDYKQLDFSDTHCKTEQSAATTSYNNTCLVLLTRVIDGVGSAAVKIDSAYLTMGRMIVLLFENMARTFFELANAQRIAILHKFEKNNATMLNFQRIWDVPCLRYYCGKKVKFKEAALSVLLILCRLSCWLRCTTNYSNTSQLKY